MYSTANAEKNENRNKLMVVLQTIETQYNNVNQLASSLRKAGAIIKVSKIKSDIFSISVNQLPRLLTIEEIVTGVVNAEDTGKVSEVAIDDKTTSEQINAVQKKRNLLSLKDSLSSKT